MNDKIISLLQQLVQNELHGVVKYTHYGLLLKGPYRLSLLTFCQEQATESLQHAQSVGDILTGYAESPQLELPAVTTDPPTSVRQMMESMLHHEDKTLGVYKELLEEARKVESVYLEDFATTMVGQEEGHGLELRKLLRDFA